MPNSLNQPLLSICITTYNRPDCLRDCLDGIVNQFQDPDVARQTEIIISDNAGSLETPALVEGYVTKYPNITYIRNPKNVGLDQNAINAVLKAQGQYCWYMADDDIPAPGALLQVMEALKKYRPALLTMDMVAFLNLEELESKILTVEQKPDYITDSANEFVKKGFCPGIFSVLVFDRELWLKTDYTDKKKDGWAYYETMFRILSIKQDRQLVHMFGPLLYAKAGSVWATEPSSYGSVGSSWAVTGSELFISLNWKKLLKSLPNLGFDQTWVNQELKSVNKNLLVILLRAKGHGLPISFKNLSILVRGLLDSPFYLPPAVLIFFIPNFLVRAVRDGRKHFRPTGT